MPARRWVNDRGQIRWQPMLEDGSVMHSLFGATWACEDNLVYGGLEKLYRSKSRAERVARREQAYRDAREERRFYRD